ncbi:MAG: Gfo/Idh/MocA family oxidoreductase [Phycisphaeraceae bacterium]|nr:Gfo/Idh/MocA family oxidoreductase [Phycisphaeraceae bacterium]
MASNPEKLRIAFIGAGGIAGAHMDRLIERDDVEIVAMADLNEEAMARKAEKYGIGQRFTDYKEMLEKVQPQAVSVCTPNFLHAPAAIDAMNAGAHALVEKPMAMNAEEGQQMVDAAEANDRKLCVAFQWRFSPKTAFLRQAIDEGQFGDVLYARVHALRRRGIPNWGVFGRKDLQGGGPMIDIGVHMLEAAHYTLGSPKPVAASGQTWTYLGDKPAEVRSVWEDWDHETYTVEDLAVGQIRFENGAILSLESSFAAHIERDVMNFSIMGEKAGANWDPSVIYRDEGGYMINSEPHWLPKGGHVTIFKAKMNDFVEHVLYDKPTQIGGEEGLMVQKMLDGIYASAEAGKEVSID